ncbi:MAG: hypothetical protein CME06_11170 [Gemmatimonadetes bacterium]|nr:hypothetical protein [Gemmatimonadota bacterium]
MKSTKKSRRNPLVAGDFHCSGARPTGPSVKSSGDRLSRCSAFSRWNGPDLVTHRFETVARSGLLRHGGDLSQALEPLILKSPQ